MNELFALIRLCDDASPVVARKVAQRLRELDARDPKSGVWREIAAQNIEVTPAQRATLEAILDTTLAVPLTASLPSENSTENNSENDEDDENLSNQFSRDQKLRDVWANIFSSSDFSSGDLPSGDEIQHLESALLALCDWQSGPGNGAKGRALLDELAIEFGDFESFNPLELEASHSGRAPQLDEAAALAQFLFEFKRLRGAATEDYYNPFQSNLTSALEDRRGLPITLACIFILVGRRVGLSIEGCSFPGHFLARDAQTQVVFDPFNGGRVLSAREIGALKKAAPAEMSEAAPAREIAARVLRNLSVAYYQSGEADKAALMLSLLQFMNAD